jgi:hypothetical protein
MFGHGPQRIGSRVGTRVRGPHPQKAGTLEVSYRMLDHGCDTLHGGLFQRVTARGILDQGLVNDGQKGCDGRCDGRGHQNVTEQFFLEIARPHAPVTLCRMVLGIDGFSNGKRDSWGLKHDWESIERRGLWQMNQPKFLRVVNVVIIVV